MPTGAQLAALAKTRIGEQYLNILVPKDNSGWHGPWDCAEFASWLAYQTVGKIYGCVDNKANPSIAEAYSGAWVRDIDRGLLKVSTEDEASHTAGIVLVRRPPTLGKMGHVAVSDGFGKTIEAAGKGLNVRQGTVRGRLWHYVVKIPELSYESTGFEAPFVQLPFMLSFQSPTTKGDLVLQLQRALKSKGFDPGLVDGEFGLMTLAAVGAFQASVDLVSDGIVGPLTAEKLGLKLPVQ
ncbi:peptidoglycan-binding domain-containing protein [Pigmentiphaga litoralis]|uniref:peptidoglycan-binding domain-containing protein n=1 Tax=Pigmentiphaga litoralis TaxID=516702 RepID=UPI003B428756